MKIALIGNYPPRECGIATFTRDLFNAVTKNSLEIKNKASGYIVAMNDPDQKYEYPADVKYVIRQNHQRDYLEAAAFINYTDAKICIVQHEFGIFGGDSGVYILSLLHKLEVPVIVTFHTVLNKPSYNEKIIVEAIGRKASKIVVMSNRAVTFLKEIYGIPEEKIALIEHGVPNFNFTHSKKYKKKFKLENKKALLTFGLLSRNKGIETVLKALPAVVKKHPDVVYIVLGKTHPGVLRVSGEEYRNYLVRLVEKNNLRRHVHFYDSFIDDRELHEYLAAIDIYITPYLNEAQITSGTLAYAVGAGAAVISTPYWHAQELLDEDRGKLFPFGDHEALSNVLNELLDNNNELLKIRKKAYNYGRKIIWPEIGKQYIKLAVQVNNKPLLIEKEQTVVDPQVLPSFSLEHVNRLTDNTGIIQHSRYSVPNFKEGYCLDDNSRALLMSVMAYRQKMDPIAKKLIPVFLSYMYYVQRDDGNFRNFLAFNGNYLDEIGTDDSFGRTIWALGYLIRFCKNEGYFELSHELFNKATAHFNELEHLRGIADTIIGIAHYLHRQNGNEPMRKALNELSNKLVKAYEKNKTENWHWFEDHLTYDNGVLPLALLHAYEINNEPKYLDIALEAIAFLEVSTFKDDTLSLIGNSSWFKKGEASAALYSQQPIDAMAMVMMYYQAYNVTKSKHYLNKMFSCFMWFLGENTLRVPLYDFETTGCCDGLEEHGVNRNQGAESTLAYLVSHLTVLLAYEQEL